MKIKNSLGDVRSHVRPVAEEVDAKWDLHWIWGIGGSGDHAAGIALDFMVYNSDQSKIRTDVGNAIAAHMVANRKRLNVQYVIWRQRIWNADRDKAGAPWSSWRRMENRGNPTANHMDHVHVSFRRTGVYGKPSGGSTPKPPAKVTVKLSKIRYGFSSADTKAMQARLIAKGFGIKSGATGYYGKQTKAAVAAAQKKHGVGPADGIVGKYTLEWLGLKVS